MKQPRCSNCKRVLTDPYSIAVGMGPECRGDARKRGVKFPKPKFAVRGGRMVFLGVEGKVITPLPVTASDEEDAGENTNEHSIKEKEVTDVGEE